jgi:iron complex outermembrane receptor protein
MISAASVVRAGTRSGRRVLQQAVCAAACFAAAGGVFAQGVLEEVIVTAQKREQSAQDVGISITAFSGDQMKTLGFQQSIDIARMTPGVHTGGSLAGQTTMFTIRGVNQNDFTDSVESPIAVYLDEGYIAMGQGQTFSLFDLERVEIAKGPQSTLFGRNATGGVVHYVTRRPTREFEAYGDITYGEYNHINFEGAVSGPLGNVLSGRVAVMYNRFDEVLDNKYTAADAPLHPGTGLPMAGSPGGGEDMWNDDTLGVRAQLLFEPQDNMSLLVSGNYARSDLSSSPYQSSPTMAIFNDAGVWVNSVKVAPDEVCQARTIGVAGCTIIPGLDGRVPAGALALDGFGNPYPAGVSDGLRPVPGGDFFGYIDEDGPDLKTRGDFAYKDLSRLESWGVTGKFTWDLDAFTVTSVSDYKDYDKFVIMDVDAAPVPQSLFQTQAETRNFSQELRLNGETERTRWLAGFYYLWIKNQTVNGLAFPVTSPLLGLVGEIPGVPPTPIFVSFAGLDANNLIELETNSYSLFGQMEFDVTDRLTLIGGLRGIIEEKDYDFRAAAFANFADTAVDTGLELFPLVIDNLGGVQPFSESTSKTLWAGKLQLDYKFTDDVLVYFGVNRGVKAGSFNAQLQDGSPRLSRDRIGYKPEILTSYEAGVKSTLWDGRARLNGSVFYYDYKDYQAFLFVQSGGFVSNNDAETVGTEWELYVQPATGWDVMLSAAWFDAKVKNLELAPGHTVNTKPSFSPELQFAGLARYEWPAFNGTMSVQGDFSYSDEFYYNIRNFDSHRYDSYVIGNFRVGYTSGDERWSVAAFVENIADERYGAMGFDLSGLCGCSEDYYGKPRWWGINLRYNFR